MKFIISRTSIWRKEPCKEAKSEKLTYLDWRTLKTLKEAKESKTMNTPVSWFSEGKNHREENGMVVRDMPQSFWTIEVKDLISFFRKYGDLIIMKSKCKEYPIEINIYDGYRE